MTNSKKTGLVLEGGAMRGMYTAGVLDVFLENDIRFAEIVGVSAGALFGVNYPSRQIGRAVRYSKRFNSDKNYMGPRPLFREGNIVSTDYAYRRVPHELDPFDDETYMQSGIPFYAVVTNLLTGEAEYKEITSVFRDMDILRASGSMPFVSKPVYLDGIPYLDGAITDSIPFRFFRERGFSKTVAILTRHASYRKKPMSKLFSKLFYRKYPRFLERLLQRHEMYNTSVEELGALEKAGDIFVIRPSEPIKMKRTERDPARLEETYQLGRRDGHAVLERLREYMET